MEFRRFFSKMSSMAEMLIILELSLFHADKVQGKNKFLKRSCLTLIERI